VDGQAITASTVTDPETARYRLRVGGPAARALAGRLPEKIPAAVYEFITTTLLERPHRVGKRLILPPFEGTWSARRGTYRVLYEIDEDDLVVTVTAIDHRGRVPVALIRSGHRAPGRPAPCPPSRLTGVHETHTCRRLHRRQRMPRTMRISRTPSSTWTAPSATKPCLR
jgi:mRNA-degrading endonuclease RelE of RelBE toxin-antitoxin system